MPIAFLLNDFVQRIFDDPHRAVLNQLRNQITHDIFRSCASLAGEAVSDLPVLRCGVRRVHPAAHARFRSAACRAVEHFQQRVLCGVNWSKVLSGIDKVEPLDQLASRVLVCRRTGSESQSEQNTFSNFNSKVMLIVEFCSSPQGPFRLRVRRPRKLTGPMRRKPVREKR